MNARSLLSLHLDRLLKVAPIVSLGLLVANLSVTLATLMTWRGGPVWAWALGIGMLLLAAVVVFAHLWAHSWDMFRGLRRAQTVHDPTQVYQLVPLHRIAWLHATIPHMESQLAIHDALGIPSQWLRDEIERLRRWERLGYIPRGEFPPHLQKYYWHNEAEL